MSAPIKPAADSWITMTRRIDDLITENHDLLAATREALKSIQELHCRETIKVCICQEECDIHADGECPVDSDMDVCRECHRFADEVDPYFGERDIQFIEWPCATARLIYTAEELAQ